MTGQLTAKTSAKLNTLLRHIAVTVHDFRYCNTFILKIFNRSKVTILSQNYRIGWQLPLFLEVFCKQNNDSIAIPNAAFLICEHNAISVGKASFPVMPMPCITNWLSCWLAITPSRWAKC